MLRDHLEDILIFWGMGWDDGLDDIMRAAAAALRRHDSMNQLIVKTFGSTDAVRGYANALRRSTSRVSAGLDDKDILKIDDQSGEWAFGQENTAVERGDLWAVNPVSFVHGYIAFDGKEVAETVDEERAEILFPITTELPEMQDLPELEIRSKRRKDEAKPGWKFQLGVQLVCVEGDNKGAEVIYKPTSMGGLKAMRKLSEEIARRLDTDEPDAIVAIVELDNKPYHNKRWGKDIHNPVIHIIEWETLDANDFNSTERDEEPKSKGKSSSKSDDGKRGSKARDDAGKRAVETRKSERTAKGDAVDKRRAADDDDEAPRGRRGRDVEVDDAEDEKVVPLARGRRAAKPEADDVEEERETAPRGRRAAAERGGDDAEDERPAARGRRARDEEEDRPARAGRGRDEDDAPRGRRGRDEDDAPRGRRAR